MKKNELEQRINEISDLRATLEKTLSMSLEELKKSESAGEEVVRILTDVSNFSRDTLGKGGGLGHEERAKFFESNIQKLSGWSASELERTRQKPSLVRERVATLQTIIGHLEERARSHEARIVAIERAADPNRDKRHPEKLSVKRAAVSLQAEEEDSE